jgi:hypothetical protein
MNKYSFFVLLSIVSLGQSLYYQKYNLPFKIKEEKTKFNLIANTNYRRDFKIDIKDNLLSIRSPIFHTKQYQLDKNINSKEISYQYINRYLVIDIPKYILKNNLSKKKTKKNVSKINNDELEYISDGLIIEDVPVFEKYLKNKDAIDGYYDTRGIYRYY